MGKLAHPSFTERALPMFLRIVNGNRNLNTVVSHLMGSECIAVLNQKGGVGKTTSVVNIGSGLAMLGRSVLLVDLDPQGHLTASLGIQDPGLSVIDVLRGEASTGEAIVEKRMGVRSFRLAAFSPHGEGGGASPLSIHVLPGGTRLREAERTLAEVPGRELLLREALSEVESDYDMILIDCPPSLGLLTMNGLAAAREVYVPVQTEHLALRSFESLVGALEEVRERLNPQLEIGGVIATRFDGRKVLNRSVLAGLEKEFEPLLLRTVIRENIALAEAPRAGKDIFTYRPSSHGAQDYLELCKEILERGRRQGLMLLAAEGRS
jgi:chromosome partitioning protein